MREFWFVRHGQSETNIGLPSKSDESTPLTAVGKKQAEFVSKSILIPPKLFVVSPYNRTSHTAAPTCEKFPGVPVETWPIQEFSYLSYAQYAGTSTRDRRQLSIKYFREGDPDLVLGEGGESFNQFIIRVEDCFQRLKQARQKRVILFGHGWFMRAGLWVLLRDSLSEAHRSVQLDRIKQSLHTSSIPMWLYNRGWDKACMRSFLLFSAAVETPNCSILKYTIDEHRDDIQLSGLDTSHLPKEYRKTSLRNR